MLPERATRRTSQKLPSIQALLQRLLSILLCLAIWTTTLRLYHRLSEANPEWMVPSWTAFFEILGVVSFVAGCVSVFVIGHEQEQAGGGQRDVGMKGAMDRTSCLRTSEGETGLNH